MVTLTITRKQILFLAGFLSLTILVNVAVAYGGNNPTVIGHSPGEIHVDINGETKTLQEAIATRDFTTPYLAPVTGGGLTNYRGKFVHDDADQGPGDWWDAMSDCRGRGGFLPSYQDYDLSRYDTPDKIGFTGFNEKRYWTSTEVPVLDHNSAMWQNVKEIDQAAADLIEASGKWIVKPRVDIGEDPSKHYVWRCFGHPS